MHGMYGIMRGIVFLAVLAPAQAPAAEPPVAAAPPAAMAAPVSSGNLPPLFIPGKTLFFQHWHGKDITTGTLTVLEVRGDWALVQYPGIKGWIRPASFDGIWWE